YGGGRGAGEWRLDDAARVAPDPGVPRQAVDEVDPHAIRDQEDEVLRTVEVGRELARLLAHLAGRAGGTSNRAHDINEVELLRGRAHKGAACERVQQRSAIRHSVSPSSAS